MSKRIRIYTVEDVATHCSSSNCWVTRNGKVYDVTRFVPDHPGGDDLILNYAGKDVGAIMKDAAEHDHSDSAYDMLEEFIVGRVGIGENIVSEDWVPDDFEPENTDEATDFEKNQFLDLRKPLLRQMWEANFTKAYYLQQVHQPRHLPDSPRLFGPDYLEILSRTVWYVIPTIWLPIAGYLFARSVVQFGLGANSLPPFFVDFVAPFRLLVSGQVPLSAMGKAVPCFLFGNLVWTLLEYIFHRFLFHMDRLLPAHPAALTLHFLLHGIHHYLPMDRLRLVMPPALFAMLSFPMTRLAHFLFPAAVANSVISGAYVFYVLYDCMHYALHHSRLPEYVQEMKRYHLAHHYKNFDLGTPTLYIFCIILLLHAPLIASRPKSDMGIFTPSGEGNSSNVSGNGAKGDVPLDVDGYPVAPPELELQQVHIYMRHGERSPVAVRMSTPPANIPEHWMFCMTARRFHAAVASASAGSHSGEDDEEPPHTRRVVERKDGTAVSTYNYGLALRKLYVDKLGFLPDVARSNDEIYLRATNMPRTIESLQQVIHGLYPISKSAKDFIPQLRIRNGKDENLFGNTLACKRLEILQVGFAQAAAAAWNRTLKPLDKKISKYIGGNPVRLDGKPRASGILDTIRAAEAHNVEVPSEFKQKGVIDVIEKAVVQEWFAGCETPGLNTRNARNGSLLSDLSRKMGLKAEKGEDDPLKILVHNTHDTCLAGLCNTLDIFDEKWPAFTSSVTFELFKKRQQDESPSSTSWQTILTPFKRPNNPTEHYVRIRYQNKNKPIPFCAGEGRHLPGSPEFCTLTAFRERVLELTPVDWEAECAPRKASMSRVYTRRVGLDSGTRIRAQPKQSQASNWKLCTYHQHTAYNKSPHSSLSLMKPQQGKLAPVPAAPSVLITDGHEIITVTWSSMPTTIVRLNSCETLPDSICSHGAIGSTPVSSTFPEYFAHDILQKYGSRPALIARGEKPRPHGGPRSPNMGVSQHLAWDFQEFDRHIQALARGLLDLGVKKGDRVGVIMGNNSAYTCLQWACASVGAILVTMNPAYRLPELVNTLKLVGVSHLFVVPRIRTSAYVHMLSDAFPALRNSQPGDIQEPSLPELKHLIVVDNLSDMRQLEHDVKDVKCAVDFRETLIWREDTSERWLLEEIMASLSKDDVVNLQFTSGTTGSPKAVSLTHHNLLNNALSIGRCMHLTPSDVICNVPPLFHCFDTSLSLALSVRNLAAWVHGACIVYPSEIYNPPAIVDALVAERCTALHGVPTHFLGVLAEVQRRRDEGEAVDTRHLRTGIAAGSPIPIDLMKQLIAKLNLTDLTNAYGMTETSPVSFQTTNTDPIIKRVETVGKVQPHVKAKVVDCEGRVVPIGTPGEIWVAGYLVQKGYWQDEEQTARVVSQDEDGTLWMHTGDEGVMDEEGYLRGEIKDIIIRGGENLFPVQIENVMTAHPAIEEAAVISVPDAHYGEVVGAWVIRAQHAQLSKEEARRIVAQAMNPQNAPAWVWFVGEDGVPEEIPKTASGKVMKHVLRGWAKDLAKKSVGRVASSSS
ncbi:putative acyl-CoA synthetase YngI [Grifola frondosa]|uniref:Putative acyl-CoA synthetase YngI n=1 Tax=Grifola frondosa TaxID=5627 RepID=A0A1C7MMH2_GRIFR|nr:putative acyl-CoA synthetase YngI [Grifola frondosa]